MTTSRASRRAASRVPAIVVPRPHAATALRVRAALVGSALALSALAATACFSSALPAQPPMQPSMHQPPPQLNITARGEVQVTPDRARVTLGVDTEAKTAQEAAQANAVLQTRIIEAVRKAGISTASIRTSGYNVAPRQQYLPETRTWRVDGYQVTNLVVIVVEPVSKAGEVIDAALSAGANRVAGLTFEVKDASAAREEAMTKAVERARREADIVAKAAGGTVAGLLELSVNSEDDTVRPAMEMAMMRVESAPTPISEGTQSIAVRVTTRWAFQSAGAAAPPR
jgi:uncharacterized protein YggE